MSKSTDAVSHKAISTPKPMKLTLNDALTELKNGNVDAAWEIAQQDEGLNKGVTKEDWLSFAYKTLDNRGISPKNTATHMNDF